MSFYFQILLYYSFTSFVAVTCYFKIHMDYGNQSRYSGRYNNKFLRCCLNQR